MNTIVRLGLTLAGTGLLVGGYGWAAYRFSDEPDVPDSASRFERSNADRWSAVRDARKMLVAVPIGLMIAAIGVLLNLAS